MVNQLSFKQDVFFKSQCSSTCPNGPRIVIPAQAAVRRIGILYGLRDVGPGYYDYFDRWVLCETDTSDRRERGDDV